MSIENLNCKIKEINAIAKINAFAKSTISQIINQIPKINIPSLPTLPIVNIQDLLKAAKDNLLNTFNINIPKLPLNCDVVPPTYQTTKPSVNVVSSILATPSSNNKDINVIGEMKYKKSYEDSKSTSLEKSATVIEALNKELPSKGVSETREYVRYFRDRHPMIDESLQYLSMFQPYSEHVGSSFLGYTPDKPSLQLEDWSSSIPTSIRSNIRRKVSKDLRVSIETTYTDLNKRFAGNLSNEFYFERREPHNTANAFHLTGDIMWINNHINMNSFLIPLVKSTVRSSLLDQLILINYLVPVEENIKISNTIFEVNVEKNKTIIDQKGNNLRQPTNMVNNTVLQPVPPSES
jgi:hypothetical protein